MRLKKILCAVLLVLTLLCAAAMAEVLTPSDEFYFQDNANVLTEETEGEIFFSNQLLDKACGAQIVVVTVDSTQPFDISDYCYDLFNKWGIGDAKKKNGFLILLAIDDENYYSVPGDNLLSKFTAGELNEYFDDYLEDDFAAGDYDGGVKKFFEAVFKRISDAYNARVTTAQGIAAYEKWARDPDREPMSAQGRGGSLNYDNYARAQDEDEGSNLFFAFILLFVLIVVMVIFINSSRRRAYTRTYGARPSVFFMPSLRRSPPPPRGPFGPGMGPGPGGMRGPGVPPSRPSSSPFGTGSRSSSRSSGGSGFGFGLGRSFGSGRSSGGFGGLGRSSGGSRSFGSARGGGGTTRGGGAGRGRH